MRQSTLRTVCVAVIAVIAVIGLLLFLSPQVRAATEPPDPVQTVRVAFIHHSVGQNWLDTDQGGLAAELQSHNYYVSDTNYGWGPDAIGDRTDIPDWPAWFTGPASATYLAALYALDEANSPYTRTLADPGGQNKVIMFKSCFPNSSLTGAPLDPPDPTPGLTVGHAKYVYNDLLTYFASHQDKLFVVVTAPPNSDAATAANARAFNTWLVDDWLSGYAGKNVAVFDFYNVLTGPDNHHRIVNGAVEHVHTPGMDTAYYRSGDDHPSVEGSRKATTEFVPILNYFYSRWTSSEPPITPGPSTSPDPTTPPDSEPATSPIPSTPNPSTPAVVPGPVKRLSARARGQRVVIRWAGPASDGYIVQVRRPRRKWHTVAELGFLARRLVWRAPTNAVTYRVRVAARNSAGRGPFTSVGVVSWSM
mgnify:CR=1 FL=1